MTQYLDKMKEVIGKMTIMRKYGSLFLQIFDDVFIG